MLRLLSIIPALVLLSFILFFLKKSINQDPVEQMLTQYEGNILGQNQAADKKLYRKKAIELGTHLPNFYISITPSHYPHNLNDVLYPDNKLIAKTLLSRTANWSLAKDIISKINENISVANQESLQFKKAVVNQDWATINSLLPKQGTELQNAFEKLNRKAIFPIPDFKWNGRHNQYHYWLTSMFQNNLRSVVDGKLVTSKIITAFKWTLSLSLTSIFLSYLLGILLGYFRTVKPSRFYSMLQRIFDGIYALPLFWLATLMLVFFTSKTYGNWMDIFPSANSIPGQSTGLLESFKLLILPIFCITAHSIGYIASQMHTNLNQELSKPYIKTAIQKGLSNHQIIKGHAFRNASFPVLTLLTSSIPLVFAGSLIIEVIFNIPGLGQLIHRSIKLSDWNVLFPAIMLIATATMMSYWLADTLYEKLDPRIAS